MNLEKKNCKAGSAEDWLASACTFALKLERKDVLSLVSTLRCFIVCWLVSLVESSQYGWSGDYLRQGYCLTFHCSWTTVFELLNIPLYKVDYCLYHALINAPFQMPACSCKFLAIKHKHLLFIFISVSFLRTHLFLVHWILCCYSLYIKCSRSLRDHRSKNWANILKFFAFVVRKVWTLLPLYKYIHMQIL